MIDSKYLTDILAMIIEGDDFELSLKNQLQHLTDSKYNYTSSGLFVYFMPTDETYVYKLNTEQCVLNGLKITNNELKIEAEAILFVNNGIIDYLEIWCYEGEYPKQDLKQYTLTQTWKDSSNRTVTTEN